MEDITIATNFFKVWVKRGSAHIPIIRETTVGFVGAEQFVITISLPVRNVNGVLWAAVGHNSDGELVGFKKAHVRRIPTEGTTNPKEYIELVNVTLTSPPGKTYDVIFGDCKSIITNNEGEIFYNVCVKDRLTNKERLLKLSTRFTAHHYKINIDTAMSYPILATMARLFRFR